jgi:DNA-directed RNA polymerase subunit N (RpoN/RPB10)
MGAEYMDFECMTCGKLFERRWFGLDRAFERVHFQSPTGYDEVEVADAEGIGVYCSRGCLNAGRPVLMKEEGVPIPPVRPGMGPIERCAKCAGPVDTSDWHLTYTDSENEETQPVCVQPIEVDYVARVCRQCAPRVDSSTVGQHDEQPSLVVASVNSI